MMYPFNMLKGMSKEDSSYLKGPLITLVLFVVVAAIIFPKPAKIYRKGVLKECSCLGLKASPRITQGVGVGETYCLGIPIKCEKTQVLRNAE